MHRKEQHLEWVANTVPILKKNEKIRVCIDFCDLNAACLKDGFSLSITDVMIDSTCGVKRMSLMASQGITKSKCPKMMKIIRHSEHHSTW